VLALGPRPARAGWAGAIPGRAGLESICAFAPPCPCSLDPKAPYFNIDLGSIVLIGYRGAEAVAEAVARGADAVPASLPASLGLPKIAIEPGTVSGEPALLPHHTQWCAAP